MTYACSQQIGFIFINYFLKSQNIHQTEKILSLLRQKDQKGLSQLYDNYAQSLLGLINGIIRDREVAEEILQVTMLKIWNSIEQYDPSKSSLFTWMAAIARHSAIDKKRLVSFQNRQKTDPVDENVYSIESVQTSTSAIDVHRLTSVLDKKYKDVLDLMYIMGYSQREVAEKLEIPLGTVKTRLRAALNLLREELKKEKKLFLGLLFVIFLLLIWL